VDGETSFMRVLQFLSFSHVEAEISVQRRELEMEIELRRGWLENAIESYIIHV